MFSLYALLYVLIVVAIVVPPLWVPIAVVIWVLVRRARKRRQHDLDGIPFPLMHKALR